MHAPSAGGQRPWSFVVIDKPSLLRKIPSIYPFSDVFETAPLGILVCGDDRLIRHRDYWVQDCAAATENILIAAEAKGLGAVWIGGYPRIWRIIGIAELLKIPDHIMPFALVAIGFPAERKHTADRYDPGRVSVNTAREPGLVRGPRRKRSKSFR
jgi:nitroreductase